MTSEGSGKISNSALAAMAISVVLIVSLYFFFPCYRYFVDGLMYSIDIRDHPDSWLVHPHHILYPLVPQVIYRLVGGTSSGLSELEYLLMFSMFAGALGIWGILMALRIGGMSPSAAIIGMFLFSFTRGIWYFAVTPNQNSIAIAFHCLSLFVMTAWALNDDNRARSKFLIWIIIFISLAILSSQLNLVLLLPMLWLVFKNDINPEKRTLEALKFLGLIILVSGGTYILVGIFLSGLGSPADFINWQHSYVYQSRWWVSDLQDAIQRNFTGIISVHIAAVFEIYGLFGNWMAQFPTSRWFIFLAVRLAQAYLIIFFFMEIIRAIALWKHTRSLLPVQAIGLIAALPIFIFSFVWAPESSNYRILYIPGLILFIVPSLQHYYNPDLFRFRKVWPVILAVVCLLGVNFVTQFLPQSHPGENPYVYEIMRLTEIVREGDLIIYSGSDEGHMKSLYAQYFNNLDTILAHDFAALIAQDADAVIEDFRTRISQGNVILVHEDAIANVDDIDWMNRNYNACLSPGQLQHFIDMWAEPLDAGILINAKRYYRLTPRQ